MRDVVAELAQRWERGETTALATVVRTYKSAPRQPGASMLRCADGTVVGSVSGGCVEGAVYELGGEVVTAGQPALERYGISDDDAFAVGLTCGGIIDVFVEPVSRATFPELGTVAADIDAERPVAVATVVEHPDPARVGRHLVVRGDEVTGSLGSARADAALGTDALGMLEAGSSGTLTYGPDGERRGEGMHVFVASYAARPRMLVFGAIDYAAAVARQGTLLGYRVTVCDARPVFTTQARFPDVDELVVDWPHRYLAGEIEAGRVDGRTVVCVMTHDPKFDVPLLQVAFGLPEGAYIGAMGSRRTHEDRLRRLRAAGTTEEEVGRMHSPIGLDLGARTPEETAVSIAAEVIALRWGGLGAPLRATTGQIHREPDGPVARLAPDTGRLS
jgi:xanthine dehydrogenase accessory factor